MNANYNKKLMLIAAPAGYGKTSVVIEYVYQGNKPFAWLHINKDIVTTFQLLSYMIFSLRRLKGDFGESLLNTISQLNEDSASIINIETVTNELIVIFINEFVITFNEQTILVLDDLHEIISNDWCKNFLEHLIRETPDNLQLVITTRHFLDINLSSLRAKRSILEVTQKELSFSHEEIKMLAKELYSLSYSDHDIEYFEKHIGGWVTGIHLIIQAMNSITKLEDIAVGFIPENLFDYFADEILQDQDQNIRDFLLRTSFLETFDSDICNKIMGISNSSGILEYLSGKNIFIESIRDITEKNNVIIKYSYNQLFRAFLMNKSKEILGEKLNSVFKEIALYYTGSGNIEEALKYLLLAKDYNSSLELLTRHFEEIFESSRFHFLWETVNSFEKITLENDKHLLYYLCLLSKYYKGNLDDALIYIDKAIEKASEDKKDHNFLISCLTTKSEILISQGAGKINSALDILKELENSEASAAERARIFYFLGNCCFNLNKYSESLDYLEKSLNICKEMELSDLEPDIYNLLGNINILKGEFVISNHYYELTYHKTRGLFKKFVAQANLTVLHSRTGKFERSRDHLKKTKELMKLFSTPLFELVVKLTDYTLFFETGDYESAFNLAREINESALKLNSSNYIFLSYRFLGECSFYMGKPGNAIEYYRLSGKYVDKSNEGDEMLLKMLVSICEFSLNNSPRHEEDLLEIYSYQDSIESNYSKEVTGYYLAKYYLKIGNTGTALKYFEKTLSLAKDKEYYSFLQREYLASPELFELALKNNIYKNFIHDIYDNITAILNIEWISRTYRDELESRIRKQFDIQMSVFGGLEFIVRGNIVEDTKWKRKKRKLILCYLLLDRNRQLSKDKIIDVFYPDTSVENADNLFHQSVSNIRTVLKTEPQKKQDDKTERIETGSQFIIYEGKTLKLNPDLTCYSDIGEFDSLIDLALKTENIEDRVKLLKSAILLYKGELLEGFYEPWCENLRSEYHNKCIKALEQLINIFAVNGQADEIEYYCNMLLERDNLNETAYLALIGYLVRGGNIISAGNKYQQMLGTFEAELGEKPSSRITDKIETMLKATKK